MKENMRTEARNAVKAVALGIVATVAIGFVLGLAGIELSQTMMGILGAGCCIFFVFAFGAKEDERQQKQTKQEENDKISDLLNSADPTIAKKCNEVVSRAMSGEYETSAQRMADMAWLGTVLGDTELAARCYQQLAK